MIHTHYFLFVPVALSMFTKCVPSMVSKYKRRDRVLALRVVRSFTVQCLFSKQNLYRSVCIIFGVFFTKLQLVSERGKKRLRVFSTKVSLSRKSIFIDECVELTMSTHDEFTHGPRKWGGSPRRIERKGKEENTLRNPTSGAESACVRGTWLYYV